MAETTITVRRESPTPLQRQRMAEEQRKKWLPRMFWDPQYYADPRNANVARSITPYGLGPQELTVSQFHRQQVAAQASMISPRMAGAMIEVLSMSPTVSPGVATALAQFADQAQFDDDLLADILKLDAEAQSGDAVSDGTRRPNPGSEADKGGWLSRTLKGLARPAVALASIPVDLVQGAIRNTVGLITDPEQREAYNADHSGIFGHIFDNPFNNTQPTPVEQSEGAQYLAGLYGPESSDLGQGWFPAGDVQARAELAKREAAPLVFNDAWTIGRGVGSMFYDDPASLGYRNLSGVIDLVSALALDPTIYVGVGAARQAAVQTAQRTAAARQAGEEIATRAVERESITLSEETANALRLAEQLQRNTLDVANQVVRDASHMYAEARKSATAAHGNTTIADLDEHLARLDLQMRDAQLDLAAARRKPTDRAAAAAGATDEVTTEAGYAVDQLTMQLGDDGLDAIMAKVNADSPDLPGAFTDAIFTSISRGKNTPNALPGADGGADAIVMWRSDKAPVLRSVDDEIDTDLLAPLMRSRVEGGRKGVLGSSNRRRVEDIITRPGATYGDLIQSFANAGRGQQLLTALKETDIDGITDVFRLNGGEGGVWWTSRNAVPVRYTPEGFRVYDGTVGSAQERIKSIRAERRAAQQHRNYIEKYRAQEQGFLDQLANHYTEVADLRTSIDDMTESVKANVEYAVGVRRSIDGKPNVSNDLLKQWLLGPTRDFDDAIAARGFETNTGLVDVNRVFTAVTTLGLSEGARLARHAIAPFATRAREAAFDAMVRMDYSPTNLGRLHRLTNGKLPPDIMRGVLNAKTEDEVLAVIGPAVGVDITRPIGPNAINTLPIRMNQLTSGRQVNTIFNKATQWAADWWERQSSITPRFGAVVNLADPQSGANVLRNYLNNIKKLSPQVADNIVGQFLHATTEVGRGRALTQGLKQVWEEMVNVNDTIRGLSGEDKALLADRLKAATRAYEGGLAAVQDYWLKKYAGDSAQGFTTIDGEIIPFVGPQLENELARGALVLPDTAEIAAAIGRWGLTLQKHPSLKTALDKVDAGMDFWRSAVLIRFAYTLRTIGEMQFRMFLTGHSSVFNSPLGAVSMASAMNKRNRTSRGLFARFARYDKTATGKTLHPVGADEADILDTNVAEFSELMARASSRQDMRAVRSAEQSHDLIPVSVGQPGFARGWAEKLIDLRQSRIARLVAGQNPKEIEPLLAHGVDRADAVVDWLLHSPSAKPIRDEYQETQSPLAQIWSDPRALKEFLFTGKGSVLERVQEYTIGGKPELVDFLVSGSLRRDGEEVFTMSTQGFSGDVKQKMMADRAVRLEHAVRPYLDEVPSDTVLNMRVALPRGGIQELGSVPKRLFDWFFSWNGRKENAWAVGPEFAYAYNDAVVDMMPMMTREAREEVYEWVQKAETRWRPHSEILGRARAYMKAPDGDLLVSDVEQVAARQAEEHVKTLFYDAQQRRQLFHSLRLAMPFAQPFFDTLWRWGRLMAARPYMIEKFGRLGEALTAQGSGTIYDNFDLIDPFTDRETRDPTQGFVWTDPVSGEAKFTFPLIGSALGAVFSPMAGFNVAESMTLNAPVQNLNLAFQGDVDYLPGVGPLVSMPMSVLMPDDWFGAFPEWLRDYAFPYGEPKPEGGLLESTFFPSWLRRLTGAAYNEEFRAYSYKGLLAYFASTKEYPGIQADPVQQQQLIDDVQSGAKWLTFIRALGAAVLPAAPTQEIYAADTDGRLIGATYLAAHWQWLLQESGNDYEAATKAFIDSYGLQAIGAVVGSSEGDPALSGPGYEFYKKHPRESEAYGDILGYFFPGDMSLDAYQMQQGSDDRVRLPVEQRVERMVQFLYNAEKTQLEGRAAAEFWDVDQIEQAEEELRTRYGGVIPTFTGVDSRTRLDMVRQAIDRFPELADTRGGQGAQLLFESYDEYTELSQERYGTGLAGEKAEGVRDEFLRELDAIVAQYGGQNEAEGSVTSIARLFVNVVTPRGE